MTRVLVTGGTGFVGGWCIVELLEAGYDVTATIRDEARGPDVRDAVWRCLGQADRQFDIVSADLGKDEGWEEAVEGCEFVLHVASPLDADGEDDETMISSARDGCLRVLDAAEAAGVKRVVMTSSSAASMPPSSQLTGTVTESVWSDPEEPGIGGYRRSKILAEQAAWDRVAESSMELVTILPVVVLGPPISSGSLSSLRIVTSLLDGSAVAIPRLGFEVVDVRDVTSAHLLAMLAPEAPGHRFNVAGEMLWFAEIADILRERLGDEAGQVPTATLADDQFRSLAEGSRDLRGVLPSLGRELRHSTDKARDLLGWSPRPAVETILDTARYLIDASVV